LGGGRAKKEIKQKTPDGREKKGEAIFNKQRREWGRGG